MANTTGPVISSIGDWVFQNRILYHGARKGREILALPTPTDAQKVVARLLITGVMPVQALAFYISGASPAIEAAVAAGNASSVDDADIDQAFDDVIETWGAALATPIPQ